MCLPPGRAAPHKRCDGAWPAGRPGRSGAFDAAAGGPSASLQPQETPLEPQHLFLAEQTEALLLKDGPRLDGLVDFDDQDGALVGDEAGTVIEVDVVLAQQIGYRLQRPGLV